MTWSEVLRTGILPGALAGLAGGVVFGVTMSELGLLPTFAELVRADSPAVGFIVLMVVSAFVGGGFGLVVCYQRPGVGETAFWGLVYGVFWWYFGPLTLMPLLQGDGLTWDVSSAQAEFPRLLGHVLYGAATRVGPRAPPVEALRQVQDPGSQRRRPSAWQHGWAVRGRTFRRDAELTGPHCWPSQQWWTRA